MCPLHGVYLFITYYSCIFMCVVHKISYYVPCMCIGVLLHFMYVHMCVCMFVYVCACMFVYTYGYVFVYMYKYVQGGEDS